MVITRLPLVSLLIASLVMVCAATAQDAAAPADVPNPALAERLAAAAQETLRAQDAGAASWKASAALLRAANRLAPQEPRFARLLAEAVARVGEDQQTIDALTGYRQLVPSDQSAQIEQVDLYLRVMETADAKVNYLRNLTGAESVEAPVRAHAAFRLAEVLEERSEMQASDEAMAEALKLDPLNLDALSMSYRRLPADAPREKRVETILALLRSNPAQAPIASALAHELASAGLYKPALQWYSTALGVYRNTGTAPSEDEVLGYASAAYLAGESKTAEGLLASYLQYVPGSIDGWLLRLLVARDSGDKEAAEKIQKQTAVALANELARLRQAAGEQAATTQPIDPPADAQWPDPGAVLKLVTESDKPNIKESLVPAALYVAWFKIYFQEKPDEAQPWIGVLKTQLVENSQTVARLEGWSLLLQGKADEARVKLSAAADVDPLAKLGLIRLAPNEGDEKAAADAEARKLLAEHGTGVVGANIAAALSFRGIKPAPTEASGPVNAELVKFPAQLARILDYPGVLYALRVEPLKTSHQFGDPMLLRVTIQNNSEYDLTLGADGIVRGDLWFDAQMRGIANQVFPNIAFDRLGGPVVLPARKSVSQVVRANQGSLAEFLTQNPTMSLQLAFTVTTNPITLGGNVGPAPAGQRITSARLVERRGIPNNANLVEQRSLDAMSNGSSEDRIRAVEQVAAFVPFFGAAPVNDQEPTAVEAKRKSLMALLDVLRRGAADGDPGVRAWAQYCNAWMGVEADRTAAIESMSADSAWPSRMMAVLLSHRTALGRATIAKLAESDADPVVKDYAAAVATLPATTQPTTHQAATQPTAPAAPAPAPAAP